MKGAEPDDVRATHTRWRTSQERRPYQPAGPNVYGRAVQGAAAAPAAAAQGHPSVAREALLPVLFCAERRGLVPEDDAAPARAASGAAAGAQWAALRRGAAT